MESGLINSLWKKITREEKSHEENIDFPDRVQRACENKNTLEYNEAVAKARELKMKGYTAEQLIGLGEEEMIKLCGQEVVDVAVIAGALKKLEELEKAK